MPAPRVSAAIEAEISEMWLQGARPTDIFNKTQVSYNTIYRIKREMEEPRERAPRVERADPMAAITGERCTRCHFLEPHRCLELEDFTRSGEARPMPEAVHFEGDLKGEVKAAYDKFMSTRKRRQFTAPLRYGKGPQR